jgi:uncharacterized membrane protein YfcA
MSDIEKLILFGLVNLVASTLSGAAGGGGGLISVPFMVTLGLSPATAIATAKFGGFGISAGASSRFFREKITNRRTIIILSIISAIGALAGSSLLVIFSDQQNFLENLMGIIILTVGIPVLYLRNIGIKARKPSTLMKIIGSLLMGLGILLQAALGSGVGGLQMVVLIVFFGMTALTASATRRAIQLVVHTISLIVFITAGLVDYKFGLVGLVSSFAGGFLGAHIAVKKGDKFILNIFAVTSAILALQLIFG